ncbi:hypothetical protein [Salipiger mucosus]|uniref:Uncharacterized protein n=1 Tax=Salipiger mucosus DSM 16094 TaxID=1123237 RepID=S9S166_9RHOB|nr:hypothetical protein [Salipiger mucosus]EPX83960.1 hypothetical protein Salmuc_01735 [Salipiger mucosus DSM 16094]
MPGIEDFNPTDRQYLDLDEVIDGGTANDIAAKLHSIEADIRKKRDIEGEITFEMTPNSLCAMWTPEHDPEPEVPEETYEQKVQRRRQAVYAKQVQQLRKAAAALDIPPAPGATVT